MFCHQYVESTPQDVEGGTNISQAKNVRENMVLRHFFLVWQTFPRNNTTRRGQWQQASNIYPAQHVHENNSSLASWSRTGMCSDPWKGVHRNISKAKQVRGNNSSEALFGAFSKCWSRIEMCSPVVQKGSCL